MHWGNLNLAWADEGTSYFIVQLHVLEYMGITTEYPHSLLNGGEKFLSKVWIKFEITGTTPNEHYLDKILINRCDPISFS